MAVHEKAVYATAWTCHDGVVYRPGERLDGRMPEHAVRGAVEQGLTSGSHADAERAKSAEAERVRDVGEQQRTRAEKREPEERD